MEVVHEALYRAVANSKEVSWGNPDTKDKCDRLYKTFLGYFSDFNIEDYVKEMFGIVSPNPLHED